MRESPRKIFNLNIMKKFKHYRQRSTVSDTDLKLPSHCIHSLAISIVNSCLNAVLGCNLINDRMISVRFQGKPFNITVIQVYAPTSNAEEAEVERFCEDLTRPFRTNTQKRCPFHYGGLECKSRKLRNTWSNRQIWPQNTE